MYDLQTSRTLISTSEGISKDSTCPFQSIPWAVIEKCLQEDSPLSQKLSSLSVLYVQGKGVGFDLSTGITQRLNQICFAIDTLSRDALVTRHSIQLAGRSIPPYCTTNVPISVLEEPCEKVSFLDANVFRGRMLHPDLLIFKLVEDWIHLCEAAHGQECNASDIGSPAYSGEDLLSWMLLQCASFQPAGRADIWP